MYVYVYMCMCMCMFVSIHTDDWAAELYRIHGDGYIHTYLHMHIHGHTIDDEAAELYRIHKDTRGALQCNIHSCIHRHMHIYTRTHAQMMGLQSCTEFMRTCEVLCSVIWSTFRYALVCVCCLFVCVCVCAFMHVNVVVLNS
jgi:hypothetical protein